MKGYRYFIREHPRLPWEEVTMTQFVMAERAAGFRPKYGGPGLATGGFTGSNGVKGTIISEGNTPDQYDWDPELRDAAWPPVKPTGDAEFDSIISNFNWGDPA